VRLQAPAANLAPSLAIMADAALATELPARPVRAAEAAPPGPDRPGKGAAEQPGGAPGPGLLYGQEHAYGKPAQRHRPAASKASRRDDLAQWHATWFRPGSATLVVAGDTTLDKLLPALEARSASGQAGSAPAKQGSGVPRHRRQARLPDRQAGRAAIDHRRGPPVAALRPAGRPGDRAGDAQLRRHRDLAPEPQPAPGQALELRHQRAPDEVRGQRSFIAMAPVQTDKTVEAMREVAKEVKGVAGERPMVGAEYESIMRNMTSRLAGRFETLARWKARRWPAST
jgi:zinc protease